MALTKDHRHPYIRGTAPLSQLDLRSGVSKNGKQCYDHHFQDTPSNTVKMTQILTNLLVLNQMIGNLFEVAAQIGHLPKEGSMAPRWISKNPNIGRQEETPSAEVPLAIKNISEEDQQLENSSSPLSLVFLFQ